MEDVKEEGGGGDDEINLPRLRKLMEKLEYRLEFADMRISRWDRDLLGDKRYHMLIAEREKIEVDIEYVRELIHEVIMKPATVNQEVN
jgi:hypothetical protein